MTNIRLMFGVSVITIIVIGMSCGVRAEDLRLDVPDSSRFAKPTDSSARSKDGLPTNAIDGVADLEAARAAIDRRTGSGMSLSLSGQVNSAVVRSSR